MYCDFLWRHRKNIDSFPTQFSHSIVFANIVVVVVLVVVGLVLCLGRAILKIIFVHGRV